MEAPDEAIVVGQVMGVHGVRGWVKVYSHTDPMDNILRYRPWWLEFGGEWHSIEVSGGQRQGKGLIAQLAGCTDRDEARARFAGCRIAVPRSALPELSEDEHYWRDLQGLRVRLTDGRDLGVVARLMETGANDVLVVRGDEQSLDRRERLIPWNPDTVIQAVELQAGTLTIDWDPDF